LYPEAQNAPGPCRSGRVGQSRVRLSKITADHARRGIGSTVLRCTKRSSMRILSLDKKQQADVALRVLVIHPHYTSELVRDICKSMRYATRKPEPISFFKHESLFTDLNLKRT